MSIPAPRPRRGFTLLEMVATIAVVSLIGLFAYAYIAPSASKSGAQVAHLSVSRVVAAAGVYAAANGRFSAEPADFVGLGRDVTVSNGPSTGPSVVSVAVSRADVFIAAALASDGSCTVVRVASLPTGGATTSLASVGVCTAAAYLDAGDPSR